MVVPGIVDSTALSHFAGIRMFGEEAGSYGDANLWKFLLVPTLGHSSPVRTSRMVW